MVKSHPSNDPHSDPPRFNITSVTFLTGACLRPYVTDNVIVMLSRGDLFERARRPCCQLVIVECQEHMYNKSDIKSKVFQRMNVNFME